jgi:tetratricopeptide (TPR) repeat protein
MVDLVQQLAGAKTDEARQEAVFAHVLDGLPSDLFDTATALAIPHWFDRSILEVMAKRHAEMAPEHLGTLTTLGLMAEQSEETYSSPRGVRDLLLRRLVDKQLDRFRRLSADYSTIFLSAKAETLAPEIEGIYHALGADAKTGGRLMLERGLLWKSEPLFQWDALDRLVTDAGEQNRRGVLDEDCHAYMGLLRLFVQRLRQSPNEEIAILEAWQSRPPRNEVFIAEAQLRRGYAELATGEIENAQATLSSALELCERAHRSLGIIEALRGLARIALRRDDYPQATHYFQSALIQADQLGLIASGAHSLKGMADIDFLQGNYRSAEAGYDKAIAEFHQTGSRVGEANTRVALAQLCALQHRFSEADTHLKLAMSAYAPLRQDLGVGNCLKAQGLVLYERAAPAQTLDYLANADVHYGKVANKTGLSYSNLMRAMSLIALDRLDEAEHSLKEGWNDLAALRDRYGLALVERERGLLAERREAFGTALNLLTGARAAFDALPNPVESAATFLAIGRVAVQLGFPPSYDRNTLIETAGGAAALFEENRLPRRQRETQELLASLGVVTIQQQRALDGAGL